MKCQTMDGVVLKDTSVAWRCPAHGTTRLNLGPMDLWRETPKSSYLAWQWTDAAHPGDTLRQSALWEDAVVVNLPTSHIDVSVSGDRLTIVSAGYVPMAWVGCNVPGRFSNNGMPLEPNVPVHITFSPEEDQVGPRTFQVRGTGQ